MMKILFIFRTTASEWIYGANRGWGRDTWNTGGFGSSQSIVQVFLSLCSVVKNKTYQEYKYPKQTFTPIFKNKIIPKI